MPFESPSQLHILGVHRVILAALCVTTTLIAVPATAQQAAAPSLIAPISNEQRIGSRPKTGPAYERYTPFFCATMLGRLMNAVGAPYRDNWREQWPDTSAAAVHADSLTIRNGRQMIRAEIGRCLERHSSASIPPRHRLGLAIAQLGMDDIAGARATFDQVVQADAQAPVDVRAWTLSRVVRAALDGAPERIALALHYMAQLDALGPSVAGRRLETRIELYNLARTLDSVSLMDAQARAALKTSLEIQGEQKMQWERLRITAVENVADVHARRGEFEAAINVLRQASDSPEYPPLAFQSTIGRLSMHGKPLNALMATFLYVPGDTHLVTGRPLPARGKVTLLVSASHRDLDRTQPMYAMLQRLNAKHSGALEIVLVANTTGWDDDGRLPNPAVEASRMRAFFHDYLALPSPLVIWAKRSTGVRHDGRQLSQSSPNLIPGGVAPLALVDREGRLRMMFLDLYGNRIAHLIDELAR